MLRLYPPFFGLYRRLTRAVELAGVPVPAQDSVMLCWVAASWPGSARFTPIAC